jgi:hypothetical protein
MARHERASAFGGNDGHAYSVAVWVDDEPDARGRYGASRLFVRWTPAGDAPAVLDESAPLAWGRTPVEAEERLKAFSLYDVKAALDEAIAAQPGEW